MTTCKRMVGVIGVSAVLALAGGLAHAGQPEEQPQQERTSVGIHTSDSARAVADVWLKLAGIQGLQIGAVHEIGLIYVVDIVKADAHKALVNQLIIRAGDGYTEAVH